MLSESKKEVIDDQFGCILYAKNINKKTIIML